MKTVGAILGISSLLVTLVAAAPLDKRVVVWHTVTRQVIQTVDVTTTITVGATGKPYAQALPKTTTTSTSSTPPPVQSNQQEKATPASSPEYTWSYSFPQTTSAKEEAAAAPSKEAKAPEPITTSAPPVQPYVPPPASSSPPPPPPAPSPSPATSSAAAPPAPVAKPATYSSTDSSTGGKCTQGKPCPGPITFNLYTPDPGTYLACGQSNIDGTAVSLVALPFGFMGERSNDNPYCGKKVTIMRGDKSVEATVMDKCMGCIDTHIDLSMAAFGALASEYEGMVSKDVTWYLHDQ